MKGLTDRQELVLDFLKKFMGTNGHPPTLREIGEELGFNFPAAKGHLKALERKGFVKLTAGRSRGIELIGSIGGGGAEAPLMLPLVGEIRAGNPILANEQVESHVTVDKDLFTDEDSFVLRVVGDSMITAGIFEGDFVIVSPRPQVEQGAIGVALIDDEATVKRIYIEGEQVKLVPENPDMEPLIYPAQEVSIIGKVSGVIRKL